MTTYAQCEDNPDIEWPEEDDEEIDEGCLASW
jgi:peptide deformylase